MALILNRVQEGAVNMVDRVALIGLAVMGRNLALNLADHGIHVVLHNRTTSKIDETLLEGKGLPLSGAYSLSELVEKLPQPRTIILMVQAGNAVDDLITALLPYLDRGDILIDGGNSFFQDSERRYRTLQAKGISFLAVGISGGEKGARFGPSIMVGGDRAGWEATKEALQKISAKAEDGSDCCHYFGEGGCGHYVKMVHNAIEYGDMQLIAESYALLRDLFQGNNQAIADLFRQWNLGRLKSYLIEITATILAKREQGSDLIDQILDKARQKGTGKWSVVEAIELGAPLTLIAEALFARNLSFLKEEREKASRILPAATLPSENSPTIEIVEKGLFIAKLISYAQGFMQLQLANQQYGWSIDLRKVALTWRSGCIIRSRFLDDIAKAFEGSIDNLLFADLFQKTVKEDIQGLRQLMHLGIDRGISLPSFGAAISFYDGYRTARSTANLIQAQRDFFGSHTYERVDRPAGEFFHTEWEEK